MVFPKKPDRDRKEKKVFLDEFENWYSFKGNLTLEDNSLKDVK